MAAYEKRCGICEASFAAARSDARTCTKPAVKGASKFAKFGKAVGGAAVLAAPIEVLTWGERSQGDLHKTKQKGSSMQQIGRAVFEDKSGHFFQQKGIGRGIGMVPITRAQAIALGADVRHPHRRAHHQPAHHGKGDIHIEHLHVHARNIDELASTLEKHARKKSRRGRR
jgi:hypothetical protein